MSLELQTPKTLDFPTPEEIKTPEVKDVFKKLMSQSDNTHKKLFEDLQTLYRILAGADAMQNILNMGAYKINNLSDPAAAQDAATKKYVDDNIPSLSGYMQYADTRFGVGYFTRDMTTASGTQEVAGLTNTPKLILLFCGSSNAGETSFGAALGTSVNGCIYNNTNFTAGQWTYTASAVLMIQTGAIYYSASVTAVSSTSFTITWTKTGAKTGTLHGLYIVLY